MADVSFGLFARHGHHGTQGPQGALGPRPSARSRQPEGKQSKLPTTLQAIPLGIERRTNKRLVSRPVQAGCDLEWGRPRSHGVLQPQARCTTSAPHSCPGGFPHETHGHATHPLPSAPAKGVLSVLICGGGAVHFAYYRRFSKNDDDHRVPSGSRVSRMPIVDSLFNRLVQRLA